MIDRYLHDVIIAMESILANKLKSVLTGLGIIFGVAAVISMLAIGNGARQEILEQIKMVGVNNILITPIVTPEDEGTSSEDTGENKDKAKFSPGLSLADAEAILEILPTVKRISPEVALNSYILQMGKREQAKLVGVTNEYFDIYSLQLQQGTFFNDYQEENGIPVCVIGANIDSKFFPKENAIGKYIKFDVIWLKVIGVLQKNEINLTAFENTGVNVFNDNVYVPAKTMLMRFQNRALVSSRIKQTQSNVRGGGGPRFFRISVNPTQNTNKNYHQLDKIIVQVNESEELTPSTEIISRMMFRRHEEVKDYEITVPELLLKQEQRTKDIFNIVLGAIASISLLVGGIGIMNIMFASVMERIKEIGTRMAIGAKKMDIIVQFLSEAVLISVTGGLIGVVIGIVLAKLINQLAGILTIVSPFSVLIAFFVSASVGIVFGYSPAKRASEKDPIESLRHE